MKDPQVQIINLTPHSISILKKEFAPFNPSIAKRTIIWVVAAVFEPSGTVLSCPANTEQEAFVYAGWPYQIPLTYTHYRLPSDLPPFIPNTIYVVSDVVAKLCPHRPDFRIVNGLIRDTNGKILGCRSLGRIKPPFDGPLLEDVYENFLDIFHMIDKEDEALAEPMHKALSKFEELLQQLTTKG